MSRYLTLGSALLIQTAFTASLITAFLALPDVDSYHWLLAYREFGKGAADTAVARFLYLGFTRMTDYLLPGNDIATFKYILPSLSLLTLIPAWLVARTYTSRLWQLVWLLSNWASPIFITYTSTPIPQGLAGTLTLFGALCLILHIRVGGHRSQIIAGTSFIAAALIHEVAAVVAAVWALTLLISYRHQLITRTRSALIPLGILILVGIITLKYSAWWTYYGPYLDWLAHQAVSDLEINLQFPARFTNIDGSTASWPGVRGIMQYYLYTTGPLLLLSSLGLLGFAVRYRRQWRQLLSSPSLVVLSASAITYLFFAEGAPRLGIGTLPDRAWLMAAPLITCLAIWLAAERQRWTASLVLILLSINAGAAWYVNSLRAHIVPDYQITAAQWIAETVPPTAVITTAQSLDYISAYFPHQIMDLPPTTWCADRNPESRSTIVRAAAPQSYLIWLRPDPHHPYRNRPWFDQNHVGCTLDPVTPTSVVGELVYADSDRALIWLVH